jgi:hypothetical protein
MLSVKTCLNYDYILYKYKFNFQKASHPKRVRYSLRILISSGLKQLISNLQLTNLYF